MRIIFLTLTPRNRILLNSLFGVPFSLCAIFFCCLEKYLTVQENYAFDNTRILIDTFKNYFKFKFNFEFQFEFKIAEGFLGGSNLEAYRNKLSFLWKQFSIKVATILEICSENLKYSNEYLEISDFFFHKK